MAILRYLLSVLFIFALILHCDLAVATTNKKVWRIAYIESGLDNEFDRIFQAMCLSLQKMNLINSEVDLESTEKTAVELWQDLATTYKKQDQIVFVKDAIYSAKWDIKLVETIKQEIFTRVQQDEVDLLLVFGSMAGSAIASLDINIPVLVIASTNPVDAGIINSISDSGKDNLVASFVPHKVKEQTLLFHDTFQFKKLGIVYEDTATGHGEIGLSEIEEAAAISGFSLERCQYKDKLSVQKRRECYQQLVDRNVDAVYITETVIIEEQFIYNILALLIEAKIPTFAQRASLVSYGALLSLSNDNFVKEGTVNAEHIAKIIHGTKARDLKQIFDVPKNLHINLSMATLIGWDPPIEILASVDKFYRNIKRMLPQTTALEQKKN